MMQSPARDEKLSSGHKVFGGLTVQPAQPASRTLR